MRRIVTLASCFALVLGMTSATKAEVFTADQFWSKVLQQSAVHDLDLQAGASAIRVIFTTAGQIDASSDDWGVYDTMGDQQAENGSITGTFGLTEAQWQPLVTTADSSTAPSASAQPVLDWVVSGNDRHVFNTQGIYLGTDSAVGGILDVDLMSGSNVRHDQSGDVVGYGGSVAVWTGTQDDGTASIASTTLGNDWVAIGSPGSESDWLFAGASPKSITQLDKSGAQVTIDLNRSIYVMSDDVQVVPEPSTILMWLGFTGIASMVYWRKRRS